MKLKRLIVLVGAILLVTGCTTDKYGESFLYGFRKPSTTTELGIKYLLGQGVTKDYKRAFYYFNQAAQKGDPLAQNELGYMYATGKGTARDDEKAFLYYHQAAEHGLASAQDTLGLLYWYGRGTPRNKEKALEYFKKSADAGFEPGRVDLKRYSAMR